MCDFLPSKHRLQQVSRQSFNIHWLPKHLPNTDLPSLWLDNPVSVKPYSIQSSVSWEILIVWNWNCYVSVQKQKRTAWTQTHQILHNPPVSERNATVKLQWPTSIKTLIFEFTWDPGQVLHKKWNPKDIKDNPLILKVLSTFFMNRDAITILLFICRWLPFLDMKLQLPF